jgi:hypothetical protein
LHKQEWNWNHVLRVGKAFCVCVCWLPFVSEWRTEKLWFNFQVKIWKSEHKIMELTRIKNHQMFRNTQGLLLYRYGNKSRRKMTQLFILLVVLLMPLTCDGEEKIVRVDPLGLYFMIKNQKLICELQLLSSFSRRTFFIKLLDESHRKSFPFHKLQILKYINYWN